MGPRSETGSEGREEEKGSTRKRKRTHSVCARDRDRDREKETTRETRGTFVAVGTIRCLEPRVVANHLLGVKNSKLRVDMGLCLHRLQPTTGLRGTDVPVIPGALLLYISRFSPDARV